jgi:hypothetical protein
MKGNARHETRAKRARKKSLRNALIWAFVFVFTFSVAGGIIAMAVVR